MRKKTIAICQDILNEVDSFSINGGIGSDYKIAWLEVDDKCYDIYVFHKESGDIEDNKDNVKSLYKAIIEIHDILQGSGEASTFIKMSQANHKWKVFLKMISKETKW